MDEAVRRGLPGWYEQAVADAGINAVGDPKLDLDDLPERALPLAFSIEVGVVPPAKLGEYKGLEVGRREPSADPDEVQAELERLRESLASLETVERAAGSGDFVVIDFVGSVDGEEFEGGDGARPPGRARLRPADPRLRGAARGRRGGRRARGRRSPSPTTIRPSTWPARRPPSRSRSRRSRRRSCQSSTTSSPSRPAATTRSTSCARRSSSASARPRSAQIEGEFREAAVDAAVAAREGGGPARARPRQGARDVAPHLAALRPAGHRPAPVPQMAGKTEEELVTEAEPDAEQALKREAVLAAIVAAEGIEVSDEEIDEALREAAGPDAERQAGQARAQARPLPGRRRGAARGHRDAQGGRPAGGERQADSGRAGRRAREALDAREGEATKGPGEIWTPGSSAYARLAGP